MVDESNAHDDAPDFQDIRKGLQERINLLEGILSDATEKFVADRTKLEAEHKKNVDSLKGTILNYRRMLDLEEGFVRTMEKSKAKVGPTHPEAPVVAPDAHLSLSDFLLTKMQEFGPLDKATLRGLAHQAGYFREDEGGRQTHAALVSLTRNGRVFVGAQGLYEIAVKRGELLE